MPRPPTRILISCGEASGDLYAGELLRSLKERDPGILAYGLGGDGLASQGGELVTHIRELSVAGLVEVVSSLPRLRRTLKALLAKVDAAPPAAAVLIDYSGFNLRLARELQHRHIPILYYVSPQVWAWRRGRIKAIRRMVDRMMVLFPFEVPLYEESGVPVSFVGHPLVDVVRPTPDRDVLLRELGLDPARPLVALLPGSRPQEIARILPTLVEATAILEGSRPDLQYAIAEATSLAAGTVATRIGRRIPIVRGRTHALVGAAEATILASGSATVETALLGTPMVVVYRVSRLSYLLGRAFVRVPHFAMVNLIAQRRLVPELIQGDLTATKVAEETRRLLEDPDARRTQRDGLALVRERLGGPGASGRAADIVLAAIHRGAFRDSTG